MSEKAGRHIVAVSSGREIAFRRIGSGPPVALLLVIDTSGMRELQLWGAEEGLPNTFPEIDTLARRCRFADCRHEAEPGCAVQAAVKAGEIAMTRFNSYLSIVAELETDDRHGHRRHGRPLSRRDAGTGDDARR